jgi:diguanylate cyclase (GGDEF)-like protein
LNTDRVQPRHTPLRRASRARHETLRDGALLVAGILAVGWIDWVTGTDIRVIALYFVPMAFAGWRLKRRGAVLAAVGGAVVWTLAQHSGGVRYAHAAIWLVNLVTQGAAFLTVGALVAALTERLAVEQALSRTDALTGLQNRRGLADQAGIALALCRRHGWPVSLACIDLDHFKRVNDSHGHAAGDQVLAACAEVLTAALRASDLAARLGGDEFAVLLPATGLDQAVTLMDGIRRQLADHETLRAVGVTATVGLATDDRSSMSIDQLIAAADHGLYAGKKRGRNQVFATTGG